MRLSDPDLRALLAAEYALGTLEGAARRNFARRAALDPALARQVVTWQTYFNTLGAGIQPVAPGPWVWQALERRLGFVPRNEDVVQSKPVFGINFWRGATAVAAACAVVLALLVYHEPAPLVEVPEPAAPEQADQLAGPTEAPEQVPTVPAIIAPEPAEPVTGVPAETLAVLLTDEADRAGWLIVQQTPGAPLIARAVTPAPLPPGKAYELWLLPEGRQPISMGLAPTEGEVAIRPPPELAALIEPGVALAISLEPAGGSPIGVPTGPVLYQGKVMVM